MAAEIVSIVDANLYVVRTKDDRDGVRISVVVFMPRTGTSFVLATHTMAQIQSGDGFGELAGALAPEFIQRISKGKIEPALAPLGSKRTKPKRAMGDGE